jgi:hypothetical protein
VQPLTQRKLQFKLQQHQNKLRKAQLRPQPQILKRKQLQYRQA